MFGSKSEEPTIIGIGASIEGTIKVSGRVQVDGSIEGALQVEGQVSVGPKGRIVGEVVADDLAVGGRIEGKVTARKHLHMVSTGHVEGDVCYGTLQVDRGAVIDGRTVHGDATQDSPETEERDRPSVAPPPPAAATLS